MSGQLLTLEQTLNLLSETPRRIAGLTAGLDQAQAITAPAPGEWSANEVLAHLRSCADVWGNCITTILAENKPVLRAINPTTWIKTTGYPQLEFAPSLEAYLNQRAVLLSTLKPLAPAAWDRPATVTGAGAPLQRTLHFYAQWLARHERSHIKQIQTIVKIVQTN
ncbi:MAG: DinB family protein [Chloroflexi bacterium]|nr:DinB family protein [Chloroflexota bacterium]OJW03452.1 MAG: hypothetical protein BGO39_10630 [Chloroflexi bacterium 54-19]